jgi:multisubunit Na+/H+ antiporter MnhG subunit
LDDAANPIAWLMERRGGTRVILWAGALVVASPYLFYLVYPVVFRLLGASSYVSLVWPLGLFLTALGSTLLAWAATRFFVAARGTGELELLLTTPFGATEIVRAQWAVLKHQLRWPMLIMVAPAALQAGVAFLTMGGGAFGPADSYRLPSTISSLMSGVNVFLGIGALCWVGLWFGLKAGGQVRAIVWTVGLVKGLPTLVGIFCSFVLNAVVRPWAPNGIVLFWMAVCLPAVLDLVFYLWLIGLARQRLRGELAPAEPIRFDVRQSVSSAARDAVATFHAWRHWTPS